MQAKDFRSAVAQFELCVRVEPARPEFHYAHALALSHTGAWMPARAAIERCLKLRPDYPGADSLAGEIETQLGLAEAEGGRYSEAADRFRAVTKLQPGFPGGHYNLGLALLNLGNAAEAEKAFRQVLKLAPQHEKAQSQLARSLLLQAQAGDRALMREAADAYRKAIRLRPADPELHFNLAYALGRLSDDEGALAEYREVLRLQPDYPTAHASLGFTSYRLGDWTGAEEHLRKALARGQDNFSVHYFLGTVLLKSGHRGEAEQQLQKAARMDPEHPGVHFQLSALYRAAQDLQRASTEQAAFRELSVRQEAEWQAAALQKAAKAALERGDLVQGINALAQAYQSHPDAESARNLGLAHLQAGNTTEARRFLQKALEHSPNDAAACNYAGLLEAKEGNLAGAQTYFERAASLDPSLVEARYNAGVAALRLGRTETAIRHLEAALAGANTPRTHEALALALAEAGRHEAARQHFDAAQKQQQDIP